MQSHTVDTHRRVASRIWAEYAVRAMWERHMIEIECDTSMAHGITSWAFSLFRLVLHGPLVGAGTGAYSAGRGT